MKLDTAKMRSEAKARFDAAKATFSAAEAEYVRVIRAIEQVEALASETARATDKADVTHDEQKDLERPWSLRDALREALRTAPSGLNVQEALDQIVQKYPNLAATRPKVALALSRMVHKNNELKTRVYSDGLMRYLLANTPERE